VALSRADIGRARAWLARRIGLGRLAAEAAPVLAELRVARDRRSRASQRHVDPPDPAAAARPAPASPVPSSATDSVPAPAAEGETLAARLARRRREGR
jgi:hypothetical protein